MISVTERAKEELKNLLITHEAESDEGLRLLPSTDGTFILGIDAEMSGDQVIEYQGYKVLLVGIEYFQVLDGKIVDCQDTRHGVVLLVR